MTVCVDQTKSKAELIEDLTLALLKLAQERERCAKIADSAESVLGYDVHIGPGAKWIAEWIAAKIRSGE